MKLTKDDFKRLTGYEPEQDDLERVNCTKAGELGHQHCGICPEHKLPRFMCGCLATKRKGVTK